MPLITRRSSTRRAPGWFFGRCRLIAAHCVSLSQNLFAMATLHRSTGITFKNDINILIWFRP